MISGIEQCPAPSSNELRTLARIDAPPDVRLACQLRPTGPVGVVPLLDALATAQPGRDAPPPTIEREVAVLLVDVLGWIGPANLHSAHDQVYGSNLALAEIGDAIAKAGGVCMRCDAEGAVAVFGIAVDARTACKQALDAARNIEQAFTALNARLGEEFGFAADVALAVHSGPAAIGAIGYGSTRASAAYRSSRRSATAAAPAMRKEFSDAIWLTSRSGELSQRKGEIAALRRPFRGTSAPDRSQSARPRRSPTRSKPGLIKPTSTD